ncbi:MAG: hypothetical protein V2A76_19185 [Planctomycetota bacterium]
MTDERDPILDDLKAAYQGIEPPERSDSLEDEDPLTRATVEWLRSAWAGLPIPEARPPLRVRSRLFRIVTRSHSQVAAAMVFLGVMIGTYLLTQDTPEGRPGPGPATPTTKVASLGGQESRTLPPRPTTQVGLPMAPLGLAPGGLRIRIQLTGLELAGGLNGFGQATLIPTGTVTRDPDRLLQMAKAWNQSGNWSRAMEASSLVLRMGDATQEQRCQALYHLAHAQQGLGLTELSKESLCRLESELMN